MNSIATSEKTLRGSAYAGIFFSLFSGYLSLASVLPLLPTYIREKFGASDSIVGFAVVATALTAVVARPVAGAIADRIGYKPVMVIGLVLLATAGLLYNAAPQLPALVACRFLAGVGEAAVFTAGAAWTVLLAPQHRRGKLIGLYGVSMWGGISAGTAIGALLARHGASSVWWFAAAAPLAGLMTLALVKAPIQYSVVLKRHRFLLRPAILPGLALALASAGYAVLVAFGVLHLESRGIGSGVAVLSVFSGVYASTRLFIGDFPDRFGPRLIVKWAAIGEAAGLLIIAFAPTLPIALAGGAVMGVGFSLLHPSLALIVINRVDPSEQGAALGAYTSFWDLGLGFWGPAMGVVSQSLGMTAAFVAAAMASLATVLLSRLAMTPNEPQAAPVQRR